MEENKIITETNEATDKKFCTSCGAELHPEAVMCPACGAAQEVSAEAEEKKLKGFKKFINRFKTDKKLWIICGGVLATIVIAVVVSVLVYRSSLRYYWNKTNDTYPKANCGLGSDFIELDTNTYDIDTDDMTLTQYRMYIYNLEDTLNAIKFLNNEFGFSSSVYDDMMETSSLMGTQSISNSKYRISWTYHPDEGLEVRYEKN